MTRLTFDVTDSECSDVMKAIIEACGNKDPWSEHYGMLLAAICRDWLAIRRRMEKVKQGAEK